MANLKKGTVVLLFTAIAYLVTIIYLLNEGYNPDREFIGETSLEVVQEIAAAEKVQLYIDQAARNAMYLAFYDVREQGLFDEKTCSFEAGKVLLFSEGSCTLDEEKLQALFLERFAKYFGLFLTKDVLGVSFVDGVNNYDLSVSFKKKSVEVVGKARKNLPFKGEAVAYDLNPSFREKVTYNFYDYFIIYNILAEQLPCVERHKAAFVSTCQLSREFEWTSELKDAFLFVDVAAKEHKYSATNIALSFAINLNTLQKTPNNLFINGNT